MNNGIVSTRKCTDCIFCRQTSQRCYLPVEFFNSPINLPDFMFCRYQENIFIEAYSRYSDDAFIKIPSLELEPCVGSIDWTLNDGLVNQ